MTFPHFAGNLRIGGIQGDFTATADRISLVHFDSSRSIDERANLLIQAAVDRVHREEDNVDTVQRVHALGADPQGP